MIFQSFEHSNLTVLCSSLKKRTLKYIACKIYLIISIKQAPALKVETNKPTRDYLSHMCFNSEAIERIVVGTSSNLISIGQKFS